MAVWQGMRAHASLCISLSSPITPAPQWKPVKATPRAVDRRDLGRVATRLFMDGSATPSPSPTHTRMMTTAWNVKDQAATCAGCTLSERQPGVALEAGWNYDGNLGKGQKRTVDERAAGIRREVSENAAMPAAITRLPPMRSARVPPCANNRSLSCQH